MGNGHKVRRMCPELDFVATNLLVHVVNRYSYKKKLLISFVYVSRRPGQVSVEGLVSSPRVVGGQRVFKGNAPPLTPTCMAADGIYKADQGCIMEGIRLVAA